jgi:hypothetical protein
VAQPGALPASKLGSDTALGRPADAAGSGWRAADSEAAPLAESRFAMVPRHGAPGPTERAGPGDQPTAAGRGANAGPAPPDPVGGAAAVPAADGRVVRAAALIQRARLRWAKRGPARAGGAHEPAGGGEDGGGHGLRRAWARGRARAGAAALLMRGTHSHGVQAAVRGWIAARLVKNPARAAAKAVGCYGGDVSRLLDVCRARATFGSVDALAAGVRAAAEAPGVRVVRVKNLMREPGDSWWTGGFRVSRDGGALRGRTRRVRRRVWDGRATGRCWQFQAAPGARPARSGGAYLPGLTRMRRTRNRGFLILKNGFPSQSWGGGGSPEVMVRGRGRAARCAGRDPEPGRRHLRDSDSGR